jgi:serine protease
MERKWSVLLAFILLLHLLPSSATSQFLSRPPLTAKEPKWVEHEIVVKFEDGTSETLIEQFNQRQGTVSIYTSPFAGFRRLKIPQGKTVHDVLVTYKIAPHVEYAELNYIAYAFFVPNDPYYPYQWHLYNSDYGGINMQSAWDITAGDPNVVVAVLDTGVAYEDFRNFQKAPDLVNTLFVAGYDFVNRDEHPNDEEGHGTHVTGTIAQSTHNNLGTAGIAFNCSLMPVKVLSRRGYGNYTDIADGIYYATDHGADVINMSLGGAGDSITLKNAVAYAYNKGVTIVCAAGNEYNQGNLPAYPAAYDDYCIAVGATRYDRIRAPYSNTGSYLDIAAPGGDLDLDQNGDGYGDGVLQQTFGVSPKDWGYWFYAGTSMASAHVSGVAALLISQGITNPDCVRKSLEATAKDLGAPGWDEEYGWGIVDAYAALNYCTLIADFTADCWVDFEDLTVLARYWLQNEPAVDIAPVDGDGIVNFLDFAKLAENWMR